MIAVRFLGCHWDSLQARKISGAKESFKRIEIRSKCNKISLTNLVVNKIISNFLNFALECRNRIQQHQRAFKLRTSKFKAR